jgi:hypothetical protein
MGSMRIFPHRLAQEDDLLMDVMTETSRDSEDYLYAVSWDKDMSEAMFVEMSGKGWEVEYKTFPNATLFRVRKDKTYQLPFNSDGPYLTDGMGHYSILRPLELCDVVLDVDDEPWRPVP